MNKRALVIDDEDIVLESVKKILSSEGYLVDTYTNSRAGLQRAIDEDYDIVLTDIRMPDIGGMRILRDIKRVKPAIPVLIITGYATVQSAVGAMKLGAADYIEKPFTPDKLVAGVNNALTKAAGETPETQELVNREQVLMVLDRAGTDSDFVATLFYEGADALEGYDLTKAEKLAILTGDAQWIESHVGKLTAQQKRWLYQRLSAEIW